MTSPRADVSHSHYLFEPEFCNPASGWEKGQVEKNVQDARRRLWQLMPSFPDIDALNGLVTVLSRCLISLCHLGFECERADAAQI